MKKESLKSKIAEKNSSRKTKNQQKPQQTKKLFISRTNTITQPPTHIQYSAIEDERTKPQTAALKKTSKSPAKSHKADSDSNVMPSDVVSGKPALTQHRRLGSKVSQTGPGAFRITTDELRMELTSGLRPAEIADKYGVTTRAIYKRIRKMDQDDVDMVLIRHTESGDPVLDMRQQIAFLNRATMDILRDARTPANTKLSAIKRAEAQNELQARIQQIVIGVQETREFQQAVIETVNEMEIAFPGIRKAFAERLRGKRDLMKAALPPVRRN